MLNTLDNFNIDSDNITEETSHIRSIVYQEKMVRQATTTKWLELWSMYKTRPIVVAQDDGWQAKLNDGRIFELVETVGGYIRNALFFSDKWARLEATEPGLAEIVPLVNTYFLDCLNSSNLKREFRVFLTQLLLTGFSSMSLWWCDDEDNIKFKCLNSYDVHVESSQRYDPLTSYTFHEIPLNFAEFSDWVEDGLLDLGNVSVEDAWEHYGKADEIRQAQLYNLRDVAPLPAKDYVTVVEFYSPAEGCLYRCIDNDCLYTEEVDECPWLIGLLFETPEESYPLSIIDSSVGLILANNILHNKRLDNMALSIDNMWLFVDDGVTNPADIVTAPGKVIPVGRPDTLTPMRPPANNFNVTYEEAEVLDTKIDKNIGVGAMISANTYRNGERVTAQEIQAVKNAGGNRLDDIYEHIEANFIIPLLKRAYKLIQANTQKQKIIKQVGETQDSYHYFKMLPSDLKHDYRISVTATQNVIDRDRNISYIQDFLTLVTKIPQFQALINWQNLYTDLLTKFGFDDPSRYIVKANPQQSVPGDPNANPNQPQLSAPPGQSTIQQMAQQAEHIGGKPMKHAFAAKVGAGQAPNVAMNMQGVSPTDQAQLTPQQLALAQQAMMQPQDNT